MRKTKTVTVETEGRDCGKTFKLTEMSVFKAEKWAARALLALAKVSGGEVDPTTGLAGLAGFSFDNLSKLAWEDVEPLLDEMMGCVEFVPSPGVVRPLMLEAGDVEEVSTLLTLRKEILGLHFDFFKGAENSTSATKAPVQ